MSSWTAVLLTAAGCLALKALGWAVPARVLDSDRVRRVAVLLPVALLAGLVVVQAFSTGRSLRLDARAAGLLLGSGLGNQLGQREPLRRRRAELMDVVDRQRLEPGVLPGGAMQVEQHQPGVGMLCARAALAHQIGQRLLALREIGVGERDHRFVEVGIVHDLADLDLRCIGRARWCHRGGVGRR